MMTLTQAGEVDVTLNYVRTFLNKLDEQIELPEGLRERLKKLKVEVRSAIKTVHAVRKELRGGIKGNKVGSGKKSVN